MSILKGILKYGLILIALLVGAAFVMGAVMVLVPSVSFLGVRYAKVEQKGNGYEIVDAKDISGVSSIKVNADMYNVVIMQNSTSQLSVRVMLDAIGFYKTQYKEVLEDGEKVEVAKSVEETFMPQTNIAELKRGSTELVINANPVEGALSFTNREIVIKLPSGAASLRAVEIESTNGKISLENIAATDLTMKSDAGDQTLTNVKVTGKFTSESRKGALKVGVAEGATASAYSLNGPEVTIKNAFGDVTFADGINIGDSSNDKLVITNDKATIKLNNVEANFKYTGEAGLVNIKTTRGEVDIESNDAKFNIDTIAGNSYGFKAVGDGMLTLNIGELNVNTAFISTSSGAVDIQRLKGDEVTSITTKTGNVTVKNVYRSVIVNTKSGNITMAQPASGASSDITITANTEKGIVDLTKIVCAVNAKATSGSVKVSALQVNGDINVETELGVCEVLLPIATFDLVTSAAGKVTVKDLAVTVNTNALTTSHINHTEADCSDEHTVTVKSTGADVVVTGIVR